MFVSKAAVVGAGTMGGEIAQAIAASDIPVVVKDIDQKFVDHGLEKAREVTEGQLDRLVKKEKLTQEQADARLEEVMGLIEGTTTYDEFGDVDFVIEAVPEKMEIKQAVFAELDAVTPGHAILASNTSSLSITEMGDATLRPDKVVGFHFFYPASVMPLVEIIEGEETDPEAVQAAYNFAQAIKKQPITCREVPGFVVNRILNSAVGEVWRAQEEQGLSIKKIDEAIAAANVAPMGPFFLIDMLGLDTVLHVAEHLHESYGDSFYVHEGMRKLVDDGKLGAKTGGEGFYKDGEPQIEGDAEPDGEELAELLKLKALVEACLVLEEGVCTVRDIDLGMMAGAGLDPRRGLFPPFWEPTCTGSTRCWRSSRRRRPSTATASRRPTVLKRLVAQGRLGMKSGQGFYPYPQPDEGDQTETVKLETRGDVAIAWLANPPMNAISPQVIQDLGTVWEQVKASGEIGAMVIASSIPVVFSAGADIKAFTQMDEAGGEELIHTGHALLRDLGPAAWRRSPRSTRSPSAAAASWRWPATSGSPPSRPCSASPRSSSGSFPGFGGTQRLPRLVGDNKALEMNLIGDAISSAEAEAYGLANRVVPDHELFDTALSWAQGSPARRRSRSSRSSSPPTSATSTRGSSRRSRASRRRSPARTRRRASAPSSASARRSGRASNDSAGRRARGADPRGRVGRGADRRGDLGPVGDPRLPQPGQRAVGEGRPDGGRPHRRLPSRHEALLELLPAALRGARRQAPNGAHAALAELESLGTLDAVVTQNIDRLHAKAGSDRVIEVHGSISTSSCTTCRTSYPLENVGELFDDDGVATCACCMGKVKPDVVLFGELLPEAAMAEAQQLCAGADLLLCVGSSLEVYPVAGLPELTLRSGGASRSSPRARRRTTPTPW